MGLKDQKTIRIKEFESLFARGVSGTSYNPIDATPINGLTTADNIRYFPWGIGKRPGYDSLTVLAHSGTIRQIIPYSTNNTTTSAIITGYLLVTYDSGGALTRVYDSNAAVPTTPIRTEGGNWFVSIIVIFGRIYFTFHDYSTANIDSFQKYIPGQAASADNGGNGPSLAGINFASSGTAGIVTQGIHVFGVAYETNTGHITAVSTVTGIDVNFFTLANANQQVTATGLPNPLPANVTKVHILASRLVVNSSGNPTDYELFFAAEYTAIVPGTLTFNFSDESLQDSADYLYDTFGSLYCQLGFTWYSNRMIAWGEKYNSGATLGPSVLRVSEPGKPETYSLSHGFVEVFKDDGSTGIRNAFEYKGLLIIQKENKTFVTRDNGDHPNTWQVDILDGVIGGVLNGSVRSLDTIGNVKSDYTVSVTKSGVYLFDGKYSDIPLTWKIERLWQGYAERSKYNQYQIVDIPSAKHFLIRVEEEVALGNVDIQLAGDIPPTEFMHACVDGVEYGPTTDLGSNHYILNNIPAGASVQFTVWDAADTFYTQFNRAVIADVTTSYLVTRAYPADFTLLPHPAC